MSDADDTSALPIKEVTESWKVVWFPPSGDRSRTFRSKRTAVDFAETDEVAEWAPLIEWKRVTSYTETRIVSNYANKI